MEPVSDKDKRRETDMAGWRLYDAEKMITKRLLAENARLREELAAAQVDAERYRWLRDTQEGKTVRIMYRREWDNAIDDAIAKEQS